MTEAPPATVAHLVIPPDAPAFIEIAPQEDRLAQWRALQDAPGRRRRGERTLLRLAISILSSRRWAEMMKRVDIGLPPGVAAVMPRPRRPVISGRLGRGRTNAYCAHDQIVVAKLWYEAVGKGRSKSALDLLRHELVHAYLQDNDRGTIRKHHPLRFDRCYDFLKGKYAGRGTTWMWKHDCGGCRAWWKIRDRKEMWRCPYCQKTNVLQAEYRRIQRVAAAGSKVFPVDLGKYVVFREISRVE